MKKTIIIILLILSSFSLVFAQTNLAVSFQFKVDKTAPLSSETNSNTTTINNIDETVLFYSLWTDTYEGLDYYYFEWNMSGAFENSSATNFESGWSNITRTITNTNIEGSDIFYRFYAKDVNNNWNSTELKSINLLNLAPEYSQLNQNDSTPTVGNIVELSSYWTDNFNIYNSILQTDHSGSWTNNQTIIIDNQFGWSNFTWDTTGYSGETLNWRIIGIDNVTNTNTTIQNSFTVI